MTTQNKETYLLIPEKNIKEEISLGIKRITFQNENFDSLRRKFKLALA